MSSTILYSCAGGVIALPALGSALADRGDGGNLLVDPPRPVWERSALNAAELTHWAHLVAATGEAMLAVLPQLEGGCINYWEAGNWALNDAAEPKGPKVASDHRKMHMHLLGRSRFSSNPDYRWGEAPRFPAFADKQAWSRDKERLTADECAAIVECADAILRDKFDMADRAQWAPCTSCGYPAPLADGHACATS